MLMARAAAFHPVSPLNSYTLMHRPWALVLQRWILGCDTPSVGGFATQSINVLCMDGSIPRGSTRSRGTAMSDRLLVESRQFVDFFDGLPYAGSGQNRE